jgi:hypothetical protein
LLTIVDVNFDRSEMLLQVSNGKAVFNQHITSDKINRIQLGSENVKSWFSKKTLPKLEIHVKGKEEPLVLRSKKSKLNYNQAQDLILQFAKKNQIPVDE